MNLKEENEKLRELLRRVYNYVPIPDQIRIDSALSEQDGNEVASPAQDESVGIIQAIDGLEGEDPDEFKEVNVWVDLPVGTKLYATRPAQNVSFANTPEQQAVALPEGYVLMPKQCPSWLEDIYDLTVERLYPKECPYLYLPAYDAMVKALEEYQKELLNKG